MGAGILPATIYRGKLYFLFGKESKHEDNAPGYSDFGGGNEVGETFLTTAIRESTEELTGFLGNERDIRKRLMKYGTYNVEYTSDKGTYRTHIFPYFYDTELVYFYNNNQSFLQRKLPAHVFKSTKIFEKQEIRWIKASELTKQRNAFRHFYRHIVDEIVAHLDEIRAFIRKHPVSPPNTRTTHNQSRSKKHKKHKKHTKRLRASKRRNKTLKH